MASKKRIVLTELAARLRRCYVARRQVHVGAAQELADADPDLHPRWDGGTDSRGVRHKGCWEGLADLALAKNIDAHVWVDCLFSLAHEFGHTPSPEDLRNERVLVKVLAWPRECREEILMTVSGELMELEQRLFFRKRQTALSPRAALETVLADPILAVSPLTRYVRACREGLAEMAASFEQPALLQYLAASEVYEEAFGTNLPERLRALAREVKEDPS